ncbi:MAG: hypothetical protein WCV86_05565, partial [Patescibacteria group bacterium]
ITTKGLVKHVNEDVVAVADTDTSLAICICDGHWGDSAAKLASSTLISKFPKSKTEAIGILSRIEHQLFDQFRDTANPPETSVLAIQIDRHNLRLHYLGYGDCRLLISRKYRILLDLPTAPTWLGPLSYQKIRNRLPVQKAARYGMIRLRKDDRIQLFTDGIDECVYETPTLSRRWLIRHTPSEILSRVIAKGAQDNASLVLFEC